MSGGKGGGGSQPVVIGYFYNLSLHMVLCHGPVDSINKIKAGDATLWEGDVTSSQSISINQPNVFGGKLKEGGFSGVVGIRLGESTQLVDPFLSSRTGGAQTPAYRGVTSLVWNDCEYSANTARPKPWRTQATRLPRPVFSNTADQDINGSANGAYIVAEALTNSEWGLGYSESDLDQASFLACAATLKAEGFGLSLVWEQSTPLEDFITTILQHINASLYVDPSSGKFVLRLIRADYDYLSLPVFDESNIISVEDYSRVAASGLINQLTVKWIDEESNEWLSLTEHNPAVKELQGTIVSTVREYPAIVDADIARKVAVRDLSILSQPLAKVTLQVSRSGASVRIGDVFKWDWSDYGIVGMPLRVLSVNFGLLGDGRIVLECVEDVFGADLVQYVTPTGSEWVDPNPGPQPAAAVATFNASYYDTLAEFNNNNIPISLDKDFGYMFVCAAQPDPVIDTYELWANFYQFNVVDNTDYRFRGGNTFTPYAILTANAAQEYQSTLQVNFQSGVEDIRVGSLLICGSEVMELISIAGDLSSIEVHRGVLDTTPYKIPAGAQIWFYEDYRAYAPVEWPDGSIISNKVLSMTSQGVLDINSATGFQGEASPRWYLPYPPAGLKINGLVYPTIAVTGDLVVTWEPRNRVLQDNVVIHQDEVGVSPEPGVTYTFRVMDTDGTVLHTAELLETPTYTYLESQATADGAGDLFYVAVTSVREGLSSHVAHFCPVSRTGASVPDLPPNGNILFASHPDFGTYNPSSLEFVSKVSVVDLWAKNHYSTWSSSEFSGTDLELQWSNDAEVVFANTEVFTQSDYDSWFKDYQVVVKDSSNNVLRTEYVEEPLYTYSFVDNSNDAGGPRRQIKIEVRARSPQFGLSSPTVATFTNAVISPTAFTITPGFESAIIKITKPTDPDLAYYRIYRGVTSGFTRDASSLVYEGSPPFVTIQADAGVEYWYSISLIDTFGETDEITSLAQTSTSFAVDTSTFTYVGLNFKPNNPSLNRITWDAATVTKDGGTTWNITAETTGKLWTSGTMFIYYVPGDTVLKTETDLTTLIGQGGRVVATYRGGTDLTADEGRAFISGDQLLAGTVGANALVTNTAVITNGAQIGNVLQSTNYNQTNHTGWRVDKDGWIEAHTITLRDSSGNIMFSTGTGMEWSYLGNRPSDTELLNSNTTPADIGFTGDLNATYGADWNTNVINKPTGITETYYQPAVPAGGVEGDYWINSDTNEMFRHNGTDWSTSVQDTDIAAALQNAADAQATADGKIVSFAQSSAPTAEGVGDIWLDTSSSQNITKRWDGSTWVTLRDAGIGQALQDASNAAAVADSKILTFYQPGMPTAGMSSGDLWVDTNDGNKLYRYDGSLWVNIQDSAVTTAQSTAAQAIIDASDAQATADSKIVTFVQALTPVATSAGDLWFDTNDNNKLYRAAGAGDTNWVAYAQEAADWAKVFGVGKPSDGADVTADQLAGSGVNILSAKYAIVEESLPAYGTVGADATLAMDGSVSYFGSNSLSIASSGANAWVFLGATDTDYNIPLSPQRVWIISGFVRSSSASTQFQVNLKTSAVGAIYANTFQSPASANTWAPFVSVVDFTSEVSTAAVLQIKNEAGSGVTMWFDGLMLEEKIGNLNHQSAYALPAGAGGAGVSSYDDLTDKPTSLASINAAESAALSDSVKASNPITSANISTYIQGAAIGYAQINSLALVGTSNFSVKSALTGERVEQNGEGIKMYDVNGSIRIQLGKLTV